MKRLDEYREIVNLRLEALFAEGQPHRPELLNEAMAYSIRAGGKRLRPAMLLAAVEMLGGDADFALDFACAVEMIHTYSLIHDDLPGMDDDCLRRGRPTNHVVYGVGQAILAGDGLLNLAFETMLQRALTRPAWAERSLAAAGEIATGSGVTGMVAGQCLDLLSERTRSGDMATLEAIHLGKTARMFMHPLRAAARLCAATGEQLAALTDFGRAYGLLFQAADDLTDAIGDSQQAGKTLGKDEKAGKLTCVSLMGLEGTRARVNALYAEAKAALAPFGDGAALFLELAGAQAEIAR